MKKNNYIKLGILLIIGFVFFSSCEKKYSEDYKPYKPTPVSSINVELDYGTPLESYPLSVKIVSDTPTFYIEGAYKFLIDTVYASAAASYNFNNFEVGTKSGVITYDNSSSTITGGSYFVNVTVLNITGVAIVDSAFELKILDVPINVTADPDNVETQALDEGVISQLSYEVIGNPDPPLSSVSYAIKPSVTGFSVNDAGEVIKSADAAAGEHILSFMAITNLGDKLFENLLTVKVEAAPSLQYVQQDGTSPLTQVTLSPWTAYTTAAPVVEGMSPEAWEVILPAGAPDALVNAMSAEPDGSVVVAADMNIPEGEYSIGVKVTSSGASLNYEDQFVLKFEARWDETPVLTETFDYAVADGIPVEAPFTSYTVNSGVAEKSFNAIHFTKESPPRNLHSARLLYGKDGSYDVTLVLSLTNDGTWRNLRIKFGEFYGYGTIVLEFFERSLWYSYNNEPENGTFTPANWTQVMANDDPDWLSENLWGTPDALNDGDLPSTPYKEFSGLDPAQNDIFVCWRYFTEGNPDKGAQWFIDDVYVQVSKVYPAEEE